MFWFKVYMHFKIVAVKRTEKKNSTCICMYGDWTWNSIYSHVCWKIFYQYKVLSHVWNKFHIQLQNIECPFFVSFTHVEDISSHIIIWLNNSELSDWLRSSKLHVQKIKCNITPLAFKANITLDFSNIGPKIDWKFPNQCDWLLSFGCPIIN